MLVQLLFLFPGRSHAANRPGRQPFVSRHADDCRNRRLDVERLNQWRLARAEYQRPPVTGQRVVETAWRAVRNGFVFKGQPIDFLVGQAQVKVLVQRTHDGHRHGCRAAQSHAAGHLGKDLDPHRPPAQSEFVQYHPGGPFERTAILGIAGQLVLHAPARDDQVDPLVAVLDHRVHRNGNGRADGMTAIDDSVFTQQNDLAIADAHGIRFSARSGDMQVLTVGILFQLGGDLPGLPYLDFITQYQPVQDIVVQRLGHTGGGDDTAGM